MKPKIVDLGKRNAYIIGKYVKYGDSPTITLYRKQCRDRGMPQSYVTLRSKHFVDLHIEFHPVGYLFNGNYATVYRTVLDAILTFLDHPTWKPHMECEYCIAEDYISIENIPYPLLDAFLSRLLDVLLPGLSRETPENYLTTNRATKKHIESEYDAKFQSVKDTAPSGRDYRKQVMKKWNGLYDRAHFFNLFSHGDISYILGEIGQASYYDGLDTIIDKVNAQKHSKVLEDRQDAEYWLTGKEP